MAYIQNDVSYTGPGIYMLKGVNNDFVYVGSAKNICSRIKTHNQVLKKTNGHSKHMRGKLTGEEVFEAVVLEKISPEHSLYYLNNREAFYIEKYNAYGENGLNSANVRDRSKFDVESLYYTFREFRKRASDNSEKRTDYTDFLLGVTENNIRGSLEFISRMMQKIEEVS